MPAAEFLAWEEYFSIYPFTQDREDRRMAQLCAVIANMSGKSLKRPVDAAIFTPEFLKERHTFTPKSLDQQRREFQEFKQKFRDLQAVNRKVN